MDESPYFIAVLNMASFQSLTAHFPESVVNSYRAEMRNLALQKLGVDFQETEKTEVQRDVSQLEEETRASRELFWSGLNEGFSVEISGDLEGMVLELAAIEEKLEASRQPLVSRRTEIPVPQLSGKGKQAEAQLIADLQQLIAWVRKFLGSEKIEGAAEKPAVWQGRYEAIVN